ncbi:hypothetical protein ABZ345_20435 [Lentzea sp. NPDC005914]|uniref:hypothetical protein n=1 Tax=Lentzea sp. NPDC005914 TaxID=3154572 RepID=UPI0033F08B2A
MLQFGTYDLRVYPGAPHAFTNRDRDVARTARHDIETWLAATWETPSPAANHR